MYVCGGSEDTEGASKSGLSAGPNSLPAFAGKPYDRKKGRKEGRLMD